MSAEELKIQNDRILNIINCLQNELDFEILMFFIIYRELTLAKLEELIPHKSRTTVYRHLQNLLQAEMVQEIREEKVRGHILAKVYQLSQDALAVMPRYTQQQLDEMNSAEKKRLYKTIRETLYPTINFMKNTLSKMQEFLQCLQPESELFQLFEQPNFHLNLNFLSQQQFELFLQEFEKFAKELLPKIIALEQQNPTAERTHVYLTGLFPIRQMNDRLMQEKLDDIA